MLELVSVKPLFMSTTVKKTELIGAINSFAAASRSGDENLLNFSSQLLQSLIERLEFAAEAEPAEEAEVETDVS